MALNDAEILETVVTPEGNDGTVVRIQISDAPLRDDQITPDIHIDLTVRLPNVTNPRLGSMHREAINRAQQVLGRLTQQLSAFGQ